MHNICGYDDLFLSPEVLPKLWHSVRAVSVRRFFFSDKKQELFENLASAGRSAIRKAPNAMTWVASLKKLGVKDIALVIKEWNAKAPRSRQLLGTNLRLQPALNDNTVNRMKRVGVR